MKSLSISFFGRLRFPDVSFFSPDISLFGILPQGDLCTCANLNKATFSVICPQELENKHWSHLNGTSRIILIEDGRRSSEEQTCGHYYVE